MKTNLKLFSLTLLMLGSASLSAERDFIFAENPSHSKVTLQKVSNETPYRLLSAKDPQGFAFEMDDGAAWRVVGPDCALAVKSWRLNDPLIIYPCAFPRWTGTTYYVLNERTRTTANVELSFGPAPGTVTQNRIGDINYSQGQILLVDGARHTSQWSVCRNDLKKLQNWKFNQTVILGFIENSYASWFSDGAYILINVERNEFVEANLL